MTRCWQTKSQSLLNIKQSYTIPPIIGLMAEANLPHADKVVSTYPGMNSMSQRLCGDQWIALYKNEKNILYVGMDDGVMIVPVLPNGDVLFITEPSPAYGERVLFLPSGMVEPGEAPAVTANRELQEEIGYRARQLRSIGNLNPFVKYVRSRQQIFLARGLEPSKLVGDEGLDWRIEIEPHPMRRFEDLIASGRLRDSTVIAALYMARQALKAAATA